MNRRSLTMLVAAPVAVVLAGTAVATTGVVSVDGDDLFFPDATMEWRNENDVYGCG